MAGCPSSEPLLRSDTSMRFAAAVLCSPFTKVSAATWTPTALSNSNTKARKGTESMESKIQEDSGGKARMVLPLLRDRLTIRSQPLELRTVVRIPVSQPNMRLYEPAKAKLTPLRHHLAE